MNPIIIYGLLTYLTSQACHAYWEARLLYRGSTVSLLGNFRVIDYKYIYSLPHQQ